jgi:multiple sugar transport system substrate-binding protein
VAHAFALASADVQRGSYFDGGGQPANAVAWDDDRLDAATLGFFRGTRATLEGSSVRPRTAGWIGVQSAVGDLVVAFLRGDLDVGRCLQEIERAAAGEGAHP